MTIDARLLVALKGADLAASTARLTLLDKMGYGDALLGLRRFDYFDLAIETTAEPSAAVAALKRVLDRQSTFYNRNKHLYALECRWEGRTHAEGVAREDLERRFVAGLGGSGGGADSGGKDASKKFILNGSKGFLVEVLVEDDDRSARDAVAAKVQGDLAGLPDMRDATVRCRHRATVWWLALLADVPVAAEETARRIAATEKRDAGLLYNPNYQRAEIGPARRIGPERS
jgi:hypothetical protein